MPAMIVLGDRTDHGGEVIEASGVTDTHGKGIARVGDKVYCPKKSHGTTVIVTGDNTMVIDGRAVAYHGCRTSCGATLISSQAVTTVYFGDSAGRSSSASGKSNEGSNQAAEDRTSDLAGTILSASPAVNEVLQEEQWVAFNLVNAENQALAGEPYVLTDPFGVRMSGELDGEGHARVVGVKVGVCTVAFPRLGQAMTVSA